MLERVSRAQRPVQLRRKASLPVIGISNRDQIIEEDREMVVIS